MALLDSSARTPGTAGPSPRAGDARPDRHRRHSCSGRPRCAGFTATRVADEAGVSVGSLYQYFPNKHALALAIHDQTVLCDRDQDVTVGCLTRKHTVLARNFEELNRRIVGRYSKAVCHGESGCCGLESLGGVLRRGSDVLVEVEEVGRVVGGFDRRQALVVASVVGLDAVLVVAVHEVDVAALS